MKYSATDFEGMAWRKALKEYLAKSVVFLKDGTYSYLKVFEIPSLGQEDVKYPHMYFAETMGEVDDHNGTPTLIESTIFSNGSESYGLSKDGTYTEASSIVIMAEDSNQLSSVMLGLNQVMNPKSTKYGLHLNLAGLYYDRVARISVLTKGLQSITPRPQGIVSGVVNIMVELDSVKLVSVKTMRPVYGLTLEVE